MKYNHIKAIARFKYDFNWGNRMFLSTVSTTCEGTHSFKYYLPNVPEIPTPLTGNIDHWNFWRGRDKNAGLIPGMTQEGDNQLDFEFTTNDRDATGKDFDATQLEQITYPTGGIDIPISASRQKVHLTIRLLNSLLWVAMDGLEVHVYISFAISMRMVKNKEK